MRGFRSALLWMLAFLITGSTAVYQRTTGPTYPIRGVADVGGADVRFRLLRTHGGPGDAEIRIPAPEDITGTLTFRRFRSDDPWRTALLERRDDALVGRLPHQPPAGKVMYRIDLQRAGGPPVELHDEPVILRFKGHVPGPVLVTHVVFIFGGMLLAVRTGLEALRPRPRTLGLIVATLVGLVAGGLILGPVVQKFAFGAFWTGWPFGHDLTDNKTAAAVLAWLVALWRVRKQPHSRAWPLAAFAVTLAVWLIPHSVLGSELDYRAHAAGAHASAPAAQEAPRGHGSDGGSTPRPLASRVRPRA